MSRSIDYRINDLINEYLDYKGYTHTVEAFSEERETRKEPISGANNGTSPEQEKHGKIKDDLLKYFDEGKREEFFELWTEHIPTEVIDNDPTFKSLEFLLYTHFAIYYLRPHQIHNDELARENMHVFKSYMEALKGQSLSQTSDILPLFALPYVTAPEQHASFQDLFSEQWLIALRLKVSNFFDWIFSNRSLPNLVELLQNGERASRVLTQLNGENEQLKYRTRETNKQLKYLSTDYVNLISITMELVDTLQQAVVGRTITNDYIDNVCARLGLARLPELVSNMMDSPQLGSDDPFTEKLDYGKIKRDIGNPAFNPREKALLLQALRWKLTKAKTDFQRENILECYIGCDLLGCRTDVEQRTKIIKQLSSSIGGDTYYVKEEWARFINTIASLRKGRNYLTPNESLILCMQKTAVAEASDTLIKQHLLAALQKLSLRRSVQSLMINHNVIKWLIPLLSKTDRLSDYTLEYGVALLMNLCLRTNGRKRCAEIAEQSITVLSGLLTHPNQETRPYVNSSLYSILTLKSVRDKAMQLNLHDRLRSLIRTEQANSETKGQLEFLLNLLCKGGDQDGRQTSDTEQDNDDEDQDIMEADLDIGDKLRGTDKELSGDRLIDIQYTSQKVISHNRLLYSSSMSDQKSKSTPDPVLQRPVTPGQMRQSNAIHAINSLANSLAIRSHSDGFDSQMKKPSMVASDEDKQIDRERLKSQSSESIQSSISSNLDLNTN